MSLHFFADANVHSGHPQSSDGGAVRAPAAALCVHNLPETFQARGYVVKFNDDYVLDRAQ